MRRGNEEPIQVLILEDEPLIAAALGAILEDHGYAVVGPARTCLAALSLLESHDVDAAILDFVIGDENCDSAADALNAKGIPWMLTTGFETRSLPKRYRNVPVFAKPYVEHDIMHAVEDLTKAKAA